MTDMQRIEALINAGILDSEGKLVPTAANFDEVNRNHPRESEADKFRLMQGTAL